MNVAALAALAALALAIRVGLVLALGGSRSATYAYEHGAIAENLLAGKGFSVMFLGTEGPTSQQAPFYPALLAANYWLLGVGTPQAILAVQLLQCVAGAALVLAVVWLARSLVPTHPEVAWIAGCAAAVHPTHIYAVTHLQVCLWAALVLTWLLAVVSSPRCRATCSGAFLAGVLSGVLLLVEPILALALPICALAFWVLPDGLPSKPGARTEQPTQLSLACAMAPYGRAARRPRRRLPRVLVMAGVASLVVAPWIVRNWRVHGEFVFIKSTFGYAFWQGNNPASWGTDKIPTPSARSAQQAHDGTLAGVDQALWAARHETLYIDDVLLKPTGYGGLAGLSEPERCRVLGRRAWQFVRQHPDRYATLCLRRLGYFLLFDPTNPKAAHPVYRAATVVWLITSAVGVIGSRRHAVRLWPTYAIFASVTAFHALTITSVRFRIPIEPLSLVWLGYGLAFLWTKLGLPVPPRLHAYHGLMSSGPEVFVLSGGAAGRAAGGGVAVSSSPEGFVLSGPEANTAGRPALAETAAALCTGTVAGWRNEPVTGATPRPSG